MLNMHAQNHAAKVVFHKSRHEHIGPLLKALHWLPVKERVIFKIAAFVFSFFAGTLSPYLSLCFYVYTPCFYHSSSDLKRNLFLVQDENLRALVIGRSLFRLPLSGTTFLLTSNTAVLSHSSKLILNLSLLYFCLL